MANWQASVLSRGLCIDSCSSLPQTSGRKEEEDVFYSWKVHGKKENSLWGLLIL